MRAVITGANGFLGRHLAEHLVASGDAVLGIVRSGGWPYGTGDAVAERVPLVRLDLGQDWDLSAERAIVEFAPEVVFHLAALSIPADCGTSRPTSLAWDINVEGTRRILDAAGHRWGGARVVIASSCRVYQWDSSEGATVDETWPLGPNNPYGETKLAAERLGIDRGGVVCRLFHQGGPGQPDRTMLGQWTRQLAETPASTPLAIRTGEAWLDLGDVRDAARAFRVVAQQGQAGQAYNVGCGQASCSGEIAEKLVKLEAQGRLIETTNPRRIHEPIADVGRLRALGWQPEICLERTVADALEWWKQRFSACGGPAHELTARNATQ